jgi:simple sugar transport system ATP-binding protein
MQLVTKMIGKELTVLERLEQEPRTVTADAPAEPFLEAEELGRTGAIEPFSMAVRGGEIVGLAGLLGSGRTELARLLFGADRPDHGTLKIDGKPVTLRTPRVAMGHGIAFSSENRRTEGVVGELSVRENIVLALQASRGWSRPIPRRKQDELVERYIKTLGIRPANPDVAVRNLSGGNQQKVLLARWLITEPRLLIVDEPTRGIDVGAKAEIQRLLVELADGGMAVLFVSAELEEVLRLSHKIEVLRERHLIEELDNTGGGVDADRVMQAIASGANA